MIVFGLGYNDMHHNYMYYVLTKVTITCKCIMYFDKFKCIICLAKVTTACTCIMHLFKFTIACTCIMYLAKVTITCTCIMYLAKVCNYMYMYYVFG